MRRGVSTAHFTPAILNGVRQPVFVSSLPEPPMTFVFLAQQLINQPFRPPHTQYLLGSHNKTPRLRDTSVSPSRSFLSMFHPKTWPNQTEYTGIQPHRSFGFRITTYSENFRPLRKNALPLPPPLGIFFAWCASVVRYNADAASANSALASKTATDIGGMKV